MKLKRSRVSIIVVHEDNILGFTAVDPFNKKKYFFLPGGLIENNETVEAAAKRETLEETGYEVEVIANIKTVRQYDFEWNGKVHACHTQYLAGRLLNKDPLPVNDAPYNHGASWIPLSEIPKVFNYHKDILEPIVEIVQQLKS